jgi:site-specific DNA-methyltransferase (adenine-specific)
MTFRILQGDNRDTLKTLADNSVDAIVTDPPYGIDFLGKSWDANTGALETYQECLRVLKPGGHILAFSAARTYHHLAVTLEQAGFEIRDQIMWIYSSGFPKSQDIGKSIDRAAKKITSKVGTTKKTQKVVHNSPPQLLCPVCNKDANARYDCKEDECGMIYKAQTPEAEPWLGWGTALKPAHEPIALARKPLHKNNSIAKNCQQWGVGALNIDATRVPYANDKDKDSAKGFGDYENLNRNGGPTFRDDKPKPGKMGTTTHENYNAEKNADQGLRKGEQQDWIPSEAGRFPSNVIGEILQADYQKYFYCPKVSRRERHIGFEDPGPRHPGADGGGYQVHNVNDELITKKDKKKKHDPLGHIATNPNGMWDDGVQYQNQQAFSGATEKGNNHPTVKPVELMKYLIKLITPPGGIVLDPFNGSGSTGCAAVELGFDYIGCELDPAYVTIAETRIRAWQNKDTATNNYGDLFEE